MRVDKFLTSNFRFSPGIQLGWVIVLRATLAAAFLVAFGFAVLATLDQRNLPLLTPVLLSGAPKAEEPFVGRWQQSYSTNRDEREQVLKFADTPLAANVKLYLPSRHAVSLSCQASAKDLKQHEFLQGYLVELPETVVNLSQVICKIESIGTAQIQAFVTTESYLAQLQSTKLMVAGLLEGAFFALAVFCLLVGIVVRAPIYALFAAWLVFNMRVGAMTLGVDFQILGTEVPKDVLPILRKLGMGGYFITSVGLFIGLISDELLLNHRTRIVALLKCLSIGMCLAVLLPYRLFQPMMWAIVSIGIICFATGLVLAWKQTRSRKLALYTCSWGVAFLGVLFEILGAMIGLGTHMVFLNNGTGAFVSSIICALCLAEKLNESEAQRALSQQDAQNALNRFTKTYNGVPVGLLTLDNQTDLVTSNSYSDKIFKGVPKAFEDFLGRAKKEWAAVDPKGPNESSPKVFKFQVNEQTYEASSVRDGSLIELTVSDITEKEIATAKLQRLAHRDPLTELFNRFRIIELLDRRLVKMGNIVVPLDCVAMFDIDGFDRTVTHFGHKAGDEVLVEYVRRVKEALPAATTIGRLSADTIIAVLPDKGLRSTQYAVQAALDAIHGQPFETSSLQLSIKASAGLCLIESNVTSSELLATCDSALQDAKEAGGGRVVAYSERDPAWLRHKAEQQLMAKFMRAIPFEDFRIFFQPIVDLKTPTPGLRYEALVRMFDHNARLVSPAQFLPALEKAGLMSTVDLWIVRHVIEYLKTNPEHFAALECASVNLSGASLNDERFTETMLELARQHPHIVRKLCFEITEDVALKDFESTRRFISRVKAIGARIALDDFGAGYSSFAYLTQLQIDAVKIDGSLIRGLHLNGSKQAIVRAIVDLCRALNNKVVSEWVETPEELITLRNLGVDAVQGYLVGRPTDSAHAKNWKSGDALVADPVVKQIIVNTKSASAVNVS